MDEIVENIEVGYYKLLLFIVFWYKEVMEVFCYMVQGKYVGKILINCDDFEIIVQFDCSYLIIGVSGGLGMLFVNWFVDQGVGEVILVVCRDVWDVDVEGVKEIEVKGIKVIMVKVDFGDVELV